MKIVIKKGERELAVEWQWHGLIEDYVIWHFAICSYLAREDKMKKTSRDLLS